MNVGVLGGTGTAGAAAVEVLRARGHSVRVLSRREGFDVTAPGDSPDALVGLDALVDCLNPSKTTTSAARAVLVDGLSATLALAARSGVRHAVVLSIIGIDRLPVGYYRVKVEQEAVARESAVPTTIVRATQFPQLFDLAWNATRRLGVIPAPRGAVAPIDPRDVAGVLARAVEAGPGELSPLAVRGPETLDLRTLAADWRRVRGSRRPILPLPAVGGMFSAIAAGHLVDDAAERGTRGWSAWLAAQSAAPVPGAAARPETSPTPPEATR